MSRLVRGAAGTACAAILATAPGLTGGGGVRAQEAGGFLAALTLSQQIFASEDGVGTRTGFGLAVRDATRNQSISVEAVGGLEYGSGEGAAGGFDRPALRADYLYETRSTAIGLDASYSSSDVDDSFADPLTGFLILGSGTRTAFGLGTTIEFGRDAPFGGSFLARRDYVDYEGTVDPRLQDSVADRAALSLGFRIDPRIEVTAGATYLDLRAEGTGTDRRAYGLSTGVALAVTPVLSVNAAVNYDRTITSGPLRAREENSGFGATVGGTLDRPNGAYTAQVASRVGENGRRARLDLGRSLELPDGALTLGVGLQESASGGFDPLYRASYVRVLPQGQLTAAADQAYVTDIDGEEAINTNVSLGYDRALGPLDRIGATVAVQDSDVLTGTGLDARRAVFGVNYSRALTQDWALTAGAVHERTSGEGRASDSESEVFLGIERTFEWRR